MRWRQRDDLLTVEQFLRFPECRPYREFVGGRIVQKVAGGLARSMLVGELFGRLVPFARSRGLGLVCGSVRCTFGGTSLVPGLCFIDRGRIPRDGDGRLVEDLTFAPDLVIDIISSGRRVVEFEDKFEEALAAGVRMARLIDPLLEPVGSFEQGRPARWLGAGEVLNGGDVLPGFALALDEFFGSLDQD